VTANKLQLQLRHVDASVTQIDWLDTGTNTDCRYKVPRGPLAANATEVRRQLQLYLRTYIAVPGGAATSAALTGLVAAGQVLYESLFLSDDPRAAQARQLYEELDAAGPLNLSIKVEPTLIFPWTLVVPGAFTLPESGADIATVARAFWCLRHELSVSTFGAVGERRPIEPGEYRAITLLHRRIYDDARCSLTDDAELHWVRDLLDEATEGMNFGSSSFEKAVGEAAAAPGVRLRLAYLLGHANGERFEFSEGDQISAGKLAVRLNAGRQKSQPQQTILFLNGCETVTEGELFSFGDMVGQFSVAALVGTEVKVPDRFAFRYALAFLQLVLCEGWMLRRAIDKLRREHLPLSLAYSLYAADGLTITPRTDLPATLSAAIERSQANNYSLGQVKCRS
jgi:hypothetical protein